MLPTLMLTSARVKPSTVKPPSGLRRAATRISLGSKFAPESEVEVILEGYPRELVAKAVVDVTAESKVRFDKGKFTTAVKAGADIAWSVRVYKKQV